MNLTDLTNFIIALAIGGLIGLEREIYQQKKRRGFAGIRTYIVVAFLGAICSFLVQKGEWAIFGYIILAGVILLLIASYYASAVKGFMGMTTELSVILVYVLSTVAMIEKYQKMAVIFGVLLAAILSTKDLLHSFARKTKQIEWFDALKFVFMVFVILPLLPNQELTLLGVEGAFNP
ncbi:MAG: MgtC/SapB family protein, partial [Patescibacteria group bacterium]|nr:MgtC/SapB family protein [Patescibacteria group bacterium]